MISSPSGKDLTANQESFLDWYAVHDMIFHQTMPRHYADFHSFIHSNTMQTTRTSSSDPSSAAAQSAAVASYKMPVASILKQASSRASSVGEEVRSAPPPPPPSQPTTTATSNGNDLVSPMASLHVHGEGFDPGLLAERTAHDASPGEDVLHHIDNHHLPMDSGDDDGYINPFLSPVHEEHHEKQQTTHLAMLDGFVEVECAGIDSIHTTTASLHSSNEFDEDFTDNKSNITAAAAETAEKTQEEVDGDRTDGGILDVPVANEVRDFAVQSGFVVNNPFGENTVHGGDEFVDNLFENEVPGGQHTGFNPFEDHHGALGESEGVTIIKDDTSFNPFLSPSSEPTAASLHGQELPEQPTKGDDDDFGDFSDFT